MLPQLNPTHRSRPMNLMNTKLTHQHLLGSTLHMLARQHLLGCTPQILVQQLHFRRTPQILVQRHHFRRTPRDPDSTLTWHLCNHLHILHLHILFLSLPRLFLPRLFLPPIHQALQAHAIGGHLQQCLRLSNPLPNHFTQSRSTTRNLPHPASRRPHILTRVMMCSAQSPPKHLEPPNT